MVIVGVVVEVPPHPAKIATGIDIADIINIWRRRISICCLRIDITNFLTSIMDIKVDSIMSKNNYTPEEDADVDTGFETGVGVVTGSVLRYFHSCTCVMM